MKILTPSGFECLNSIIKLTNIPSCRLVFEDGNTLECAEEHILIQDNDDEIFAKDSFEKNIKINNSLYSSSKVVSVESIGEKECFDISVEGERYFTNNILSHNSTISAIFILHYVLFNSSKTVAILANKASTAIDILSRIKLAYQNLPKFLQQGVLEWSKTYIVLENGSKVLASASSSSNIRGMPISCVSIDSFITVSKKPGKILYGRIRDFIDTHYKDFIPNVFYPNNDYQVLTSYGFKYFSLFSVSYKPVIKISFLPFLFNEKETSLICTKDHLIKDKKLGIFKQASEFLPEESFGTLLHSTEAIISEIDLNYNKNTTVVDLTDVKDVHSFIANGVNVHNCLFIDECLHEETNITVKDIESGEEKTISLSELYLTL